MVQADRSPRSTRATRPRRAPRATHAVGSGPGDTVFAWLAAFGDRPSPDHVVAIFRDNTWRKRDQQGALRVSPHDAEQLGLCDGALAQITTSRGTAQAVVEIDDRLQPGHAALPNGFGLDLPTEDGVTDRVGVALNTLTDLTWRDPSPALPGTSTCPPASSPEAACRRGRS
jgi:hypothetical protein